MQAQAIALSPVTEITNRLEQIKKIDSFGPELYPFIDNTVEYISKLKREGIILKEDIKEICNYYGKAFLDNTLQGRAFRKQYGYSGDFLMIDKIYTNEISKEPFYRSWDLYIQLLSATKAVRNRKEYFKSMIFEKLKQNNSLNLLNIASGPARDLLEVYQKINHKQNLQSTCIDMDQHAVKYASSLLEKYHTHVQFVNKNIFRYKTQEKFDVIWSAGLFDYFDDKAFVHLLKRFKHWVAEKGEIIIGNFNQNHNPSREYMELICDWYLIHRSEQELLELALHAGFEREQISIGREDENVNLFLHIKCK